MNGDRLIRAATAAVVTALAAFAAVVSYSHVYDLGRTHCQAGAAARLLPLSVDGLLLAASLVLLHEARNRRAGPVAGPADAVAGNRRDARRERRLPRAIRAARRPRVSMARRELRRRGRAF